MSAKKLISLTSCHKPRLRAISSRTGVTTKESGSAISAMATESTSGPVEPNTKVNINTIVAMVTASSSTLTSQSTKETGPTIFVKAWVNSHGQTAQSTSALSSMTK